MDQLDLEVSSRAPEEKYNFDCNAFYNEWIQGSINYELNFLKKSIKKRLWNNDYFKGRINELQVELNHRNAKPILKDNKIVYQLDTSGKKPKIMEVQTNEFENYETELVYQKPWQRLKDFHRLVKIKEFVDELEYPDDADESKVASNKKRILAKLDDAMKDKKFNNARKNSQIVYDPKQMKITAITCLEFDKKKKKYRIEFS